jgi:hypothetical protein
MLRANESQSKEGTRSVALGKLRNTIGTTEQEQGVLRTRQSLAAMLIKILEEEAAKPMV